MRKSGMQVGERILLTKALGTGTLFAAAMKGKVKARWIDSAIKSMLQSNGKAAQVLKKHGCSSCTDVTGFGLLGHLGEMLRASKVGAEIELRKIPSISGAKECIEQGLLSSLHDQNQKSVIMVQNVEEVMKQPVWPILVDPQTAGGLLATVKSEYVEKVVQELKDQGYEACEIGVVRSHTDGTRNDRVKIVV
eukprot:TRINITY_DN1744_c1_g1_i1.p1 TRINITY_DN1744_c1_g1~~TRINITY_DN1744_c1_g1_i1.p1  ORF type:complete len:192 (+),score=26.55 TRINITY_DN1744_c1_g1_i1:1-576(+)